MLTLISISYLMVTVICLMTTFIHGLNHKLKPATIAGTIVLCFVWPVFILMGVVWANNISKVMDNNESDNSRK